MSDKEIWVCVVGREYRQLAQLVTKVERGLRAFNAVGLEVGRIDTDESIGVLDPEILCIFFGNNGERSFEEIVETLTIRFPKAKILGLVSSKKELKKARSRFAKVGIQKVIPFYSSPERLNAELWTLYNS